MYTFLIHHDEQALSDAERVQGSGESPELAYPSTATSVRVREGKRLVAERLPMASRGEARRRRTP